MRKRSTEAIDGPSTPPGPYKKSKKSSDVVLGRKTDDIYHRFWSRYQATFSQATFFGICAYFYSLIQWGYSLPVLAMDDFLCSHSTFVDNLNVMVVQSSRVPAYHHWFTEHRLHRNRPGSILDGESLSDIAAKHPYTFAHTEANMKLIAKKAGDGESLNS